MKNGNTLKKDEVNVNITMVDTPNVKAKKLQPDWENIFAAQLADAGLPTPLRQYTGIPNRKFRFDFCWEGVSIVVEIEGGTWGASSRHTSRAGFARDLEKYNLATKMGYKVYRFTSDRVKDKTAIEFLKEVFSGT